jgi:hypothetical protein
MSPMDVPATAAPWLVTSQIAAAAPPGTPLARTRCRAAPTSVPLWPRSISEWAKGCSNGRSDTVSPEIAPPRRDFRRRGLYVSWVTCYLLPGKQK